MSLKKTVLLSVLLALQTAGIALAGSGSEECLREEQRLRAAEAADCSGMNYLFNPSSCFITRKKLIPYDNGKCGKIAAPERFETQRPDAAREKQVESPGVATVAPAAAPHPDGGRPAAVSAPPPAISVTTVAASADIERLDRAVADLRAELQQLKEEIARLRGVQ